jgi:type I restriction enzyme S subunit
MPKGARFQGWVRMSNKTQKRGLVPKLRFPAFRDAGEWSTALLGRLLIGSPDYGVNAAAVPFADNLPKYLRITDISEDGQYLPDKQVSVDLDATDENYLDEGDIVLARTGASVGKSYRYRKEDGKLVFAGFLIRVKPDPRLLFSTYLANFLTTDQFWKWVAVTSARSGQPGLNGPEYGSLVIPLPPKFPEQQKIADCLASLDERITLEAKKLDTLKTHKKGLMQQLFPTEGETLPKLRFPEFREAGEWKKRKISSLLVRSVNPLSVEVEETYREIGIRSHGKGIFHKDPVLGKALGDKRVFRVEENAFVLNIVFAWEQAVAVTSVAERGMIASHRFPMYKPNERESDVDFIKYFFLTNKGKELLGIASPGGAGRNKTLGQKAFEKLEFLSPGRVEEQIAIARCLSSVDDLLTAQTQKLAALKAHKKGLMQQLFPSMG